MRVWGQMMSGNQYNTYRPGYYSDSQTGYAGEAIFLYAGCDA